MHKKKFPKQLILSVRHGENLGHFKGRARLSTLENGSDPGVGWSQNIDISNKFQVVMLARESHFGNHHH